MNSCDLGRDLTMLFHNEAWKLSTCLVRSERLTQANPIGNLEKLVLVLRDGRKLIGVLRSWDQFGKPLFIEHDPVL